MNQYDKIKKQVDEFNQRLEKAYDQYYGDVFTYIYILNIHLFVQSPNKPQLHPPPEINQFNTIATRVREFRNKLDNAYERYNTTIQQEEDKQQANNKASRKPFSLQKRKKIFVSHTI